MNINTLLRLSGAAYLVGLRYIVYDLDQGLSEILKLLPKKGRLKILSNLSH